jgi:hypothetical protein
MVAPFLFDQTAQTKVEYDHASRVPAAKGHRATG